MLRRAHHHDEEAADLFEAEVDDVAGYVDVPVDDYRSIRRANLDLAEFETAEPQLVIEHLAGQLALRADSTGSGLPPSSA